MSERLRTGQRPVLSFFASVSSLLLCAAWLCALETVAPQAADAQFVVRSWLPWRTIETSKFAFHYPAELEAWTRHVAAHADAVDSAVSAVVGYSPTHRTHVVVDDPYEIANGSAWPFIGQPVINLWAAPADPREDIGEFRDWGEMLVSHEFGHIAHLVRPSRNSGMRRLWRLLPVDLGPIPLDAPRWVVEGYATYIEGRVTGSGRPHGSWRPAFLRQWALEGQLPRYEQLDASGAYEGGEFAYLAGSAFLEWLAARGGDSSLVHLWRRMTAREQRGFDVAFAGVFGESPRALYGRFSAELTTKSVDAARAISAAGAGDTGSIVQRLAWSTGDPSISADGRRAAIVLRSPTAPSRIVIWSTAPEPDTGRARRDSLLLAHDPEDVAAHSIYPPPKRVLATLRARGGSAYDGPRFLRDGRVLVWRNAPRGDGSLATDLYLWDPPRRSVRRVTHGASVRDADPTPDGRSAIATRCRGGWCDVVAVDLASGAVRTLLSGSPTVTYYRPRVSPDGTHFVVATSRGGKWQVRLAPIAGEVSFDVSTDSTANWYDADWRTNGLVIAVSDRGGVANLYQLDMSLGSAWRRLTSVTGAAVAPAINRTDGSIWFLSLYSRGYDLRRIEPSASAAATSALALSSALSPAAPEPPAMATTFDSSEVSPPRGFGLGPRSFRWLPQPEVDADGASAALALVSMDLIGRSQLLVNAAYGDRAAWRGGNASVDWRGSRPALELRAFDAVERPSGSRTPVPGAALLDATLAGGEAALTGDWSYDTWAARARIGGSVARARSLADPSPAAASRSLGFAAASATWLQRGAGASLSEALSSDLSAGRSFDAPFQRALASASVALTGSSVVPVRATATYGSVSSGAAPFEQIALGGNPSALVDAALLSQRIPMPALPVGIRVGSTAFTYNATLIGNPLSFYWWGGSTAGTDGRFQSWNRVVGVEWTESTAAVPIAGTPAARVQIGVGESLDAPLRHRVRAYAGVVIGR